MALLDPVVSQSRSFGVTPRDGTLMLQNSFPSILHSFPHIQLIAIMAFDAINATLVGGCILKSRKKLMNFANWSVYQSEIRILHQFIEAPIIIFTSVRDDYRCL